MRKFVNKMIEEGDNYRNTTGYQNTDGNWKPRTYSTDPAQTTSVSYSFGGKQTIQQFIDTVSKYKAPPNTPYPATQANPTGMPDGYRGDISDNTGYIGAASNKKKWPGLYFRNPATQSMEYSIDTNSPYYMQYWAGIDCSGFVYRTMSASKTALGNVVTMSQVAGYDFMDNQASGYLNVEGIFETDRVYYIPAANFDDNIRKQFRKGDLIKYTGDEVDHSSEVYSDRPSSCSTDSKGATTCTYEIIHAYGGRCSDKKEDGSCKPGAFSRKVLKTLNKFEEFPNPTGFGRIKLWD